jgi:hypothetical protein
MQLSVTPIAQSIRRTACIRLPGESRSPWHAIAYQVGRDGPPTEQLRSANYLFLRRLTSKLHAWLWQPRPSSPGYGTMAAVLTLSLESRCLCHPVHGSHQVLLPCVPMGWVESWYQRVHGSTHLFRFYNGSCRPHAVSFVTHDMYTVLHLYRAHGEVLGDSWVSIKHYNERGACTIYARQTL